MVKIYSYAGMWSQGNFYKLDCAPFSGGASKSKRKLLTMRIMPVNRLNSHKRNLCIKIFTDNGS